MVLAAMLIKCRLSRTVARWNTDLVDLVLKLSECRTGLAIGISLTSTLCTAPIGTAKADVEHADDGMIEGPQSEQHADSASDHDPAGRFLARDHQKRKQRHQRPSYDCAHARRQPLSVGNLLGNTVQSVDAPAGRATSTDTITDFSCHGRRCVYCRSRGHGTCLSYTLSLPDL